MGLSPWGSEGVHDTEQINCGSLPKQRQEAYSQPDGDSPIFDQ